MESFTTPNIYRIRLAVILITVALIILAFALFFQPGQKQRTIPLNLAGASPNETYIVDIYDSNGVPVKRQQGAGNGDAFTFDEPSNGSIIARVTDSQGRSWTSGLINDSSLNEISWTETTPQNPLPLAIFNITDLLDNGTVVMLPNGINVTPGNEVHAGKCCTVLAVFPCEGTTCARLDCSLNGRIGHELRVFNHISECLVYANHRNDQNPQLHEPANESPNTPPRINETGCIGTKGDFDGDGILNLTDLATLKQDLDYLQRYGAYPQNLNLPCADVNGDGYTTDEDYICLEGLIEGTFGHSTDCPVCNKTSPIEVCHDGSDNDCDGQTDRETYNNQQQTFYGSAESPVDICGCNELTLCNWIYDIDGIEGISSKDDQKWCVSVSGLNGGSYKWYSDKELECTVSRYRWTMQSNCYCLDYTCTNTDGFWLWKDLYHFGFTDEPSQISGFDDFGVKWARPHPGPFRWNAIESNEGTYDFSDADKYVHSAQESGVLTIATIWPYVDWDQRNSGGQGCFASGFDDYLPKSRCKPSDLVKYSNFVTALVERYDGDGYDDMPGLECPIMYWEVINEPETGSDTSASLVFFRGTPQDYLEVLKATSKAIKTANKHALVLNGGTTGSDRDYGRNYWADVFALGGERYFEIGNFHGGDAADNDFFWFNLFRTAGRAFEKGGLVGIWVTEFDVVMENDDQAAQAREIVQWQATRFASGMDKSLYTFYSLSGNGTDEFSTSDRALIYNGVRRQAYYAMRTIIEKLDGFSRAVRLAENTYKFYVGDSVVYVIWHYDNQGDLSQISGELSGRVIVTDMLGNETAMDMSEVSVGADPIYIEPAS